MNRKQLKIGIFGYGVVGQGVYNVFNMGHNFSAEIVKICVKNPNKKRELPAEYFTTRPDDILEDEEINVVIELITDADAAFDIVSKAMQQGKSVISANKKMIAERFNELITLQKETGVSFLYEASTCASIPTLRNLEEYYDNQMLRSVEGICNGSCNYILTKMYDEGLAYDSVVEKAQELGFAEIDPYLDVSGFDTKYKLVIITAHAHGLILPPEQIFHYGIMNISDKDIQYAKEKNLKIRLVAKAARTPNGSICAYVLPLLVDETHHFYNVNNEFNGVVFEGAYAEQQMILGKGAGGLPTGTAILSDISALTYGYRYEYKKRQQAQDTQFDTDYDLEVYVRYGKESDLAQFQFNEIREKYQSSSLNYVVGTLNLNTLIALKDALEAMTDVFIAATGK